MKLRVGSRVWFCRVTRHERLSSLREPFFLVYLAYCLLVDRSRAELQQVVVTRARKFLSNKGHTMLKSLYTIAIASGFLLSGVLESPADAGHRHRKHRQTNNACCCGSSYGSNYGTYYGGSSGYQNGYHVYNQYGNGGYGYGNTGRYYQNRDSWRYPGAFGPGNVGIDANYGGLYSGGYR